MLIGILQTGSFPAELQPASGDYPDMFARLFAGRGLDFCTWNVEEMDFPAGIRDCAGWLITGSRHGAYEDHAFIPPLEDFIRAAVAAHVPVVGICFGHQIIAQALGGRVEKYAGGWIVGPQLYDIEGAPVRLNAWHQDQVTRLPDTARRLGRGEGCENAALVYGTDALSFQAHPEFSDTVVRGLAETRGPGVVPDAQLAAATAALGGRIDASGVADRIADFFLAAEGRRNADTAEGRRNVDIAEGRRHVDAADARQNVDAADTRRSADAAAPGAT